MICIGMKLSHKYYDRTVEVTSNMTWLIQVPVTVDCKTRISVAFIAQDLLN